MTLNSELLSTNHISALQMCPSCHWCSCWETLCFFYPSQISNIDFPFVCTDITVWVISVMGTLLFLWQFNGKKGMYFACWVFWLTGSESQLKIWCFSSSQWWFMCVFWIIQVQCWRLSGSDLLWSVRSDERSSAPAAGPPAGGGDGQTRPAGGSSRPGQPLFSSHTAGRHEGLLTFSCLLVIFIIIRWMCTHTANTHLCSNNM